MPICTRLTLICLLIMTIVGCENPVKKAVRDVTYSGYELIGVQKRDLLKRDIQETREDQKLAAATFEDALEKLRRLYALDSTQLEKQYRTVQSSYEDADRRAKEVRGSREKMETVAHDLFNEWEGEIGQIQTPEMKSASRTKLQHSRTRFSEMDRSLVQAERKMDPVLVKLKDHVLFLKHNLNAESLDAMKTEHQRIQTEIGSLVQDMNKSIDQADAFLKTIQ